MKLTVKDTAVWGTLATKDLFSAAQSLVEARKHLNEAAKAAVYVASAEPTGTEVSSPLAEMIGGLVQVLDSVLHDLDLEMGG